MVIMWSRTDFPAAMKNLAPMVRNKAIQIGNALLEKSKLNIGIIIATAISKAKKWVENKKLIFKNNNFKKGFKKE